MPSPCGEGGREALGRGEISGDDVDVIKRPIEVESTKSMFRAAKNTGKDLGLYRCFIFTALAGAGSQVVFLQWIRCARLRRSRSGG